MILSELLATNEWILSWWNIFKNQQNPKNETVSLASEFRVGHFVLAKSILRWKGVRISTISLAQCDFIETMERNTIMKYMCSKINGCCNQYNSTESNNNKYILCYSNIRFQFDLIIRNC